MQDFFEAGHHANKTSLIDDEASSFGKTSISYLIHELEGEQIDLTVNCIADRLYCSVLVHGLIPIL